MAHIFSTGFGLTTTVADLFEGVGTGGGGNIGAYGRNSGQGLRQTGNNSHARKNLGSTPNRVIFGFAVDLVSITDVNGSPLCGLWDAGTLQWAAVIKSDGTLSLTGYGVTAFTLPFNTYTYLEFDVTIHNTTGAINVYVNGVLQLAATGLNTRAGTGNNYATQCSLGYQGNGNTKDVYYDDFYILDTTGTALNAVLGDVRIDALMPDGAGDSTQWTPSAGSNYQCVDETPRNDDTDYVSSANIGDKDLYSIADLSVVAGAIKAVVVTMRARKDDAGTRTVKAKVKHGGVEGNGADRGMSTSYAYSQDAFPTNPSTGSAWTIAEVNAAQVGVEVVA